ncbi:MAG TPA: hypothetical protein VN618_06860 [Solirubrobacteraceae bacterium]|nr:hypothetical protein [Solirubrobacteraceae bacterium]
MEDRRAAGELLCDGFVHLREAHEDGERAWSRAEAVFGEAAKRDELGSGMPPLETVGRFNIPPIGALRREFQALHLDFGLPVEPAESADVARFTALYVAPEQGPTSAFTRIVPLRPLLGQRTWAEPEELLERLSRYGRANGAAGPRGYVEGIFARLIEAADGSPTLPTPNEEGLLCGMEFDTAAQERAHLAARGLDLERAEVRVGLGPGELLLLDNLAIAHGRLGTRRELELHQLCVGYRSLAASSQAVLRDRVLAAFAAGEPEPSAYPVAAR